MKVLSFKTALMVIVSSVFFALPLVSAADIAMIVNKQSSLDSAEMKEVKLVYLGKRKKIANVRVIPVALKNSHETTKKFITGVLSKTLKQHHSYWARLVFTGKGAPPPTLDSVEELKGWISENPEGLGFIDAKDADDTVKVVATFK